MKIKIKKTLILIGLLVLAACGSKGEELNPGSAGVAHSPGNGIPIAAPPADTTAGTEPTPIPEEPPTPPPHTNPPGGPTGL
jgi:hypothetical protein